MARPFRIGATGDPGCASNRANHPDSETGRAAVNVQDEQNPSAHPKLFRASDSAVDPAEHCHCSGIQRGDEMLGVLGTRGPRVNSVRTVPSDVPYDVPVRDLLRAGLTGRSRCVRPSELRRSRSGFSSRNGIPARAASAAAAGSNKELPTVALAKICIVSPLHAGEQTSWGRRIGIAIACLGALALAGFVGAVVGPHFKAASTSSTATTSLHRLSTTTSTVVHSSVKVLVANGTQKPNAAGHFTQQLQQSGEMLHSGGQYVRGVDDDDLLRPVAATAAALIASELACRRQRSNQ